MSTKTKEMSQFYWKKSSQKGQLGILNKFLFEIQDICLVLEDIVLNLVRSPRISAYFAQDLEVVE